ncbi:HlyD family efflux transporter periplasmic adaptor subunit [bacterium]|nr:HlyD family efflux transporter periplasmic adaptor subunit [bacterium]
MKRLIPVAIVALVLTALLLAGQSRHEPLVVSGTIEADDVRVGSRVGGRVARVLVEEGHEVAGGDALVELEPFDLREREAQARQTLAAADARLQKLTTGYRSEEIEQARALRDEAAAALDELRNGPRPQEIAAAEAQVRLAQAELKNAKLEHDRVESLFAKGAADRTELDNAETNHSVAQATVEDRQQRLALLQAGTRAEEIARGEARLRQADEELKLREAGFRSEEIDEARAQRDQAAAELQVIGRQLDELTVRAPFDGVVEAVDLRPGDIVPPNAPVITLLETGQLRVRAYVPENQLGVTTGQRVTVTVDSFPEERFDGEVTFVARQAEFTPRNVQTPEERSKQVFRLRVELRSGLDRLRPGMAADVHLDTVETQP